MARMYLIDVENKNNNGIVEANDLQDYYKLCNCDYIEIAYRNIGGMEMEIICDEEGLLKSPCRVAICDPNNPQSYKTIVGNILITGGYDYENEEYKDITNKQIEAITSNMFKIIDLSSGKCNDWDVITI